MHKASLVLAAGADFILLGPDATMILRQGPVIPCAPCAPAWARAASRARVASAHRDRGLNAVDIRHPMPYRDLLKMRVERYATVADLDAAA